ncbi:MAG: hypothetical protein CMB17_07030 [Euryarchaeota archaeon]|nr:hypothetical protein [Euryarchaeota archaeon]MBA41594.1 hypothetical protein [Euryarchaeota archaeon]|tara:strand:+ start:3385 stop:3630 length:246 start_codon:yes stop_codon:yes gene_type:complete
MNSDENITLLGREETQGKFKNQRLWNIICLIIGFGIILVSSWFSMQQNFGINDQTIILLTCFPGTIFALLIAELMSKVLDR